MTVKILGTSRKPAPFQSDCLKPNCDTRVPEGYKFQLCERHLAKAWAAFQVMLNEGEISL